MKIDRNVFYSINHICHKILQDILFELCSLVYMYILVRKRELCSSTISKLQETISNVYRSDDKSKIQGHVTLQHLLSRNKNIGTLQCTHVHVRWDSFPTLQKNYAILAFVQKMGTLCIVIGVVVGYHRMSWIPRRFF